MKSKPIDCGSPHVQPAHKYQSRPTLMLTVSIQPRDGLLISKHCDLKFTWTLYSLLPYPPPPLLLPYSPKNTPLTHLTYVVRPGT